MLMSTVGSTAPPGGPFIGSPAKATRRASQLDAIAVRIMDITVASCALAFLAPLLLVIAALVYLVDPGPIFFAHRRVGRHGKSFPCLKFRSMVVDAEARLNHLLENDADAREEWIRDFKLRHDPRITKIGHFLRKTSIDELPQFLNVLRGEMSIVGPRPIVQGEAVRYGRYFVDYIQVKPGVTGLWQVSGRNNVSYRRRVALDISYARNKCLALDLQILVKTIPAVLLAKGSY